MSFVHLHVHTQYSVLDGLASTRGLFARAKELGMPAVAITDHGNMNGVKEFFNVSKDFPEVKPIFGCEIYVTRHYDHRLKDKDHATYYHLILLAKNYDGYKNLMKIVSTGHIEGKYRRPRVSHEVVEKYSRNLICCSACIVGEVPNNILAGKFEEAEKAVMWHKRVFGDDYYLEVQLHQTEVPGLSQELAEKQNAANSAIFELAQRTGTKVVATNDVHFVNKEDGPAHDRLICLTTNSFIDDPNRLRYTQQEYLKSEEEMRELFPGHPEVIDNTMEVCDKIERFSIDRGHVLPKFKIDEAFLAEKEKYLELYDDIIEVGKCDKGGTDRGEEFRWSVAYLCHLTYEGARARYGETLNEVQAERIEFELKTISRMGFPDYFLIVQDFIAAARAVGTFVGPGRGSAAGSVVAYCLKITNLDPIKYNLLFERFLNPDRISMPDIDIDFDDEGRYGAFRYIEETYGKDHVSHVITFGTMAAKSAIKDVARISRLPLDESARLAKMVPDKNIPYKAAMEAPYKEGEILEKGEKVIEKEVEEEVEGQKVLVKKKFKVWEEDKEAKPTLKICYKYLPEFQNELENGTDLVKEVLKYAGMLEGSIRQTGVHACAMIIGRGDLTDYIPITLAEDKETGQDVWTSGYDGHYIEEVGMLKMDFLGLRTLSIIKECLRLVKKRFGDDIDIEKIPIDDPQTYALYSRGDTKSVFQFESEGMKQWLQKLQPTRFEDLIAMNALYRPGPMDYIPSFVDRKQGREVIKYDLDAMEDYLNDTYGVTVYQEQVMLLSQALAGFTKGEADKLRKAMGKKQIAVLESLHDKFIDGGEAHGHDTSILEKIWGDWRKFAAYAFNKSHATCYAWVSYQTGWLKAHYPSEFQAANLSKNLSNQEEIKAIMDDCRKSDIKVLNPDVNESDAFFTVNSNGDIRFGLGGIKGFGDNVVNAIIKERTANGNFVDVFDFVERMSGMVNRKAFEALVYSGAFDAMGYNRRLFTQPCKSGDIFIDALLRYAELYRRDSFDSGASLFGDMEEMKPVRPDLPVLTAEVLNRDNLDLLHQERELVGMYLSSHPLEIYRFEVENFTDSTLAELKDKEAEVEASGTPARMRIAGLVTANERGAYRSGKPYCRVTIEDFSGNYEISLSGKEIDKYAHMLPVNSAVLIDGRIDEKYFRSKEERALKGAPPFGFRMGEILSLGNATNQFLKEVVFHVVTPQLNEKFRKELVAILSSYKGHIPLSIMLFDPETQYNIEFSSRKFRVDVNADFIKALNKHNIIYTIKTR